MDPGERVGWARAEIFDGKMENVSCGVTPLKDFAIKLYESAPNYHTLAYETWRLRPDVARKFIGNDFQPVQIIGMIRLLGWVHGIRLQSIEPNMKTTGEKVMNDELRALKELQIEEHSKDAIDLLSYYHWNKYV